MDNCYSEKEQVRIRAFESIWRHDINAVFSDAAGYFDHPMITQAWAF